MKYIHDSGNKLIDEKTSFQVSMFQSCSGKEKYKVFFTIENRSAVYLILKTCWVLRIVSFSK